MKGMIVGRIRECKETREAVSSTHCHQKKDSTPREDVSWAKESVFGTLRRGVGREDERHLRAAGGDPRTRKEAHGANSEWCAGRAGGAQGWAQVHGPDLVTGSSERPGWALRRFFPLPPSLFAFCLPPPSCVSRWNNSRSHRHRNRASHHSHSSVGLQDNVPEIGAARSSEDERLSNRVHSQR